ncbi:MAG: DUF433 domain-containing protein, partial [Rubrobacteraceae bacterium]
VLQIGSDARDLLAALSTPLQSLSSTMIDPLPLSDLEDFLQETRRSWERREINIEGFPHLVSNTGIVGGSPTIRGTRIETSFVAYLARDLSEGELLELYPHVERSALEEAVRFENPEREKLVA